MDDRLVAWARAVKSRRREGSRGLPTLWLFTDAARVSNPLPAIRALPRCPRGLCGVVFRHDAAPGRAVLGREVALICRSRGYALVVAGDVRLAASLHAGVHLREGRRGVLRPQLLVTSSAHGRLGLHRAKRAGAAVFLSPAGPTQSHPEGPVLGVVRWTAIAARSGTPVFALGGLNGYRVRGLGRRQCRGVGAIEALLP